MERPAEEKQENPYATFSLMIPTEKCVSRLRALGAATFLSPTRDCAGGAPFEERRHRDASRGPP